MQDMPRPRPPYLSHERNYRGTMVWYVRIRGKRIRIRETYGTPEFDAAYQAALATVIKKPAPDVAAFARMAYRPVPGHCRMAA
jgi:hypothetical protein